MKFRNQTWKARLALFLGVFAASTLLLGVPLSRLPREGLTQRARADVPDGCYASPSSSPSSDPSSSPSSSPSSGLGDYCAATMCEEEVDESDWAATCAQCCENSSFPNDCVHACDSVLSSP